MQKLILIALAALLFVPMTAVAQEKISPDKDAALKFKTRKEYGVPVVNKIPFLGRLFRNFSVTEDYVWNNPLIRTTVISPDGRYLLTSLHTGQIDLWDLESPEKSRPNFAFIEPKPMKYDLDLEKNFLIVPDLCWLGFSQDASLIAVLYDGKLSMMDKSTGDTLRTLNLPEVNINWGDLWFGNVPFALSPCGKFFAYEGRENDISCIKMINAETGETVFTKTLPVVTWHNLVITAGPNGFPIQKTEPAPSEGQDNLLPMCFSPDGRHLLLMLRKHGIEILDSQTGKTVAALEPELTLEPDKKWISSQAAFSPDGKYLVTAGGVHDKIFTEIQKDDLFDRPISGKVLLWDMATFRVIRQWDVTDAGNSVDFKSVAFSQDGQQVLTAYASLRDLPGHKTLVALNISQFDVADGRLIKTTEIKERGGTPLFPEFRPLLNNQARQLHWLPETISVDFDFSIRPKSKNSFDKITAKLLDLVTF